MLVLFSHLFPIHHYCVRVEAIQNVVRILIKLEPYRSNLFICLMYKFLRDFEMTSGFDVEWLRFFFE